MLSEELFAEYEEVLQRARLVRSHRLTAGQLYELLAKLRSEGELCQPQSPAIPPPDPKDLHVWSIHEAMPDAILVTGDRALIAAARPDRRVMSPREFVDAYEL